MCTGVRLIAKNGAVVYGRTLEFGQNIESNILMIPRNYAFVATAPNGKKEGASWRSKYAVVGANMLKIIGIADGVNEQGLAGGLFYFPDYAEYQAVAESEYSNSLAPWELLTWLLTNFATVDEVKKALPTIKVSAAVFGPWGFTPPVHAIVHDASGKSLVIEYQQGKLLMYDNPIGVITNAPSFDWHLTNLKNYLNLSPVNAGKKELDTVSLTPFGQGSGMFGLPGDFTPPSRFVRAVAFSQTVTPLQNEDDARAGVFHILNLFNIPKGVVGAPENGIMVYDYTQWTSAMDLTHRRYYWHTYDNSQICVVDLTVMDLDAQEPITIALERAEKIIDATKKQALLLHK